MLALLTDFASVTAFILGFLGVASPISIDFVLHAWVSA